jgi:hypothetical protein
MPTSFAMLNHSIVPRIRIVTTLPKSVHNPPARQVVRRELDPDPVAEQYAHAVSLQAPSEIRESLVAVVELDAEHPAAQSFGDFAVQLDLIAFLVDFRSVP